MNRKLCFLILSCVLTHGFTAGESSADENLDPVASRLLIDHWDKNSANRTASKTLFNQSDAKEQILLAYTLNRMKHNRYREARVPADELTQRYPANMDGWMLRIWLDAVTNQYDRSLVGMQMMKREMVKLPALELTKQNELYLRLARIIGYLQGPVSKKVNSTTMNSVLLKVVDGMTPEQLKKFNDERTRILDQYDLLVKDKSDLQNRETQKTQAAAKVEVEAIKVQNEAIDARRKQIVPDLNRIQAEGEQKISVLEAQLSPLQQELAGVSTSIGSLELSLQAVYREQLFQQRILLRERDPLVRAIIRDRIRQLSFDAQAIQNDLFNVRSRANSIAVRADNLAAERQRVSQSYSGQLAQLNDESRQNDRQQRRNTSRLQKLAKGGGDTSPKVRVANVEVTALTTYDQFPIELFRQDYLDSMSNN